MTITHASITQIPIFKNESPSWVNDCVQAGSAPSKGFDTSRLNAACHIAALEKGQLGGRPFSCLSSAASFRPHQSHATHCFSSALAGETQHATQFVWNTLGACEIRLISPQFRGESGFNGSIQAAVTLSGRMAMAGSADGWGRLDRDHKPDSDDHDDKKHKMRRGMPLSLMARAGWRRLVRSCAPDRRSGTSKSLSPPSLLPVKCDDKCRVVVVGLPWKILAVAMVLALAFVAGTTVLALEVFGRLRFRGYFSNDGNPNGQIGFYHEMDVDMHALVDAAGNPHARLFPVTAVSQRELKAWVTERRRRTNGHKYMIGCSSDGRFPSPAAPLFDALKQQDDKWQDLVTRNPTDFFFKLNPKRAPSALLFCVHAPQKEHDRPVIDLFLKHNAYFRQLRALGALILVWSDDLRHYNQLNPLVIREQIFKQADVLIGPYAYAMDEFFASVSAPVDPRDLPMVMWLPHAAGPEFAVAPLNGLPISKLLLPNGAEATSSCPLRRWLRENQVAHPDLLDSISYHAALQPTEYAAYTRSYRATVTTTLQFQYLLAELFEIAATGSLLVVNRDVAPLLAALGLHEMEHFVGFDRSNPAPTIQWVADPEHQLEVDAIRLAGMQVVRDHHLAENRQAALEAFVSDGVAPYQYNAGSQLPSACPSAGTASDAACRALIDRDARHRCDRWLCGFRSVLPRTWKRWWWPW